MKIVQIILLILIIIGLGLLATQKYWLDPLTQYILNKENPQSVIELGYISSIDKAKMEILFDDAVWMSGAEGENIAIKLGHCTEDRREECLPNDYIIYNEIKENKKVTLDKNVKVVMQTWKAEEFGVKDQEITLDELEQAIANSNLHWSRLPYRISIINNKIVQINEVYIP